MLLVEEVGSRKMILFSRLSDIVSNDRRLKFWKENSVSVCKRVADEVRKNECTGRRKKLIPKQAKRS